MDIFNDLLSETETQTFNEVKLIEALQKVNDKEYMTFNIRKRHK